jgi:predicted RecA/RadA family phage recombinase
MQDRERRIEVGESGLFAVRKVRTHLHFPGTVRVSQEGNYEANHHGSAVYCAYAATVQAGNGSAVPHVGVALFAALQKALP